MSTLQKNPSTVGSAMAALLKQVPDALRDQIRDAWSADLQFMFTTGLNAGERLVWDAAERHGLVPKETQAPAVTSRPSLRVLAGGAR